MTKKSKKKAIKTGTRHTEKSGLVLSVHLGLNVSKQDVLKASVDGGKSYDHQRKRTKKNKQLFDVEEEKDRVSYPFDLWFHVGRFIAPDQVRTFALISHNCWKVTQTAQFWLSLYQRYVKRGNTLPFRLQPENIDSGPGLKSKVVRALYFVHLPLQETHRSNALEVTGLKCVLFWWKKEYSHKKGTFIWNYFFKLADTSRKQKAKQSLSLYNTEENKVVIKIRSPNFIHFQKSVLGMVLTKFNSCMSTDMRYHQIKMVFHYEGTVGNYNKNDGFHLGVNPAIDVSTIPWWNQNYPYPEE